LVQASSLPLSVPWVHAEWSSYMPSFGLTNKMEILMKGEFIEQELFLGGFIMTLVDEIIIRSSVRTWGREQWKNDCNGDRFEQRYRVEGYGNPQRICLKKKKKNGEWIRFNLPNKLGPPDGEADLWDMVYSFDW